MKILLNKNRSVTSKNDTSYTSVELGNKMKKIANSADQHLVDLYQVYLDEKDASDKYRLIFTINPVCSNVLFNSITEVVYKEGSNECFCLHGNETADTSSFANVVSREPLDRLQAIRDTEYSNPGIMGLSYLPGVDIFNNHIARQNGLNCVMPRKASDCAVTGMTYTYVSGSTFEPGRELTDVFNTIRDYQRTMEGKGVVKKFPGLDSTYLNPISGQAHLYEGSEVLTFEQTFTSKISEKDGWFGFYNPSTLDIPVETKDNVDLYVNRLLNNAGSCDFVDMFPDRKRFTFVPQKNEYRENRLEYNWKYCLTYPYSTTEYLLNPDGTPKTDDGGMPVLNEIVAGMDACGNTRNGLSFTVVSEFVTDSDKRRLLLMSDSSIHNLSQKDLINVYYVSESGEFSGKRNIQVKGLGNKNGELQQYYFTIDSDDAPYEWFDEDGKLIPGMSGRFCKVVFGIECKYYFRVFRRLPNFTEISQDEEAMYHIGKYNKSEYDFNSEINKLAFANNIYGDSIVQIVYLDDVDVKGITDNLERPLSDIYLTIVKANDGHEEWYPESGGTNYTVDTITMARAFGKVTSGIDLPPEDGFMRDYNVHRIHNINFKKVCEEYGGEYTRPYENLGNLFKNYNVVKTGGTMCDYELENLKVLEDDITIDQEFFLGDLVEFNVPQYMETVIEPVYHRFNTAQREYVSKDYKDIVIDEIYMDDYEGSETAVTGNSGETIEGNFKCIEDIYNKGYEDDIINNKKTLVTYPGNLFPEGYYYQPHYRIHLKDVSDSISQSSDMQVELTEDGLTTGSTDNEVFFTTSGDYDLIEKDEVVIMDPKNNIFYDAVVTDASGVTGDTVVRAVLKNGDRLNYGVSDPPLSFLVFKKTLGIPKYAIHYPDTSGKYIWRSVLPPSKVKTDSEIYDKPFTNGAHYRHIGLNFFLKRQDPYGYYELNSKNEYSTGDVNKLTNVTFNGRMNESIYYNDAIEFGLIDIC